MYGTTCRLTRVDVVPGRDPLGVGPAQAVDERRIVHGQDRIEPQVGCLDDPAPGSDQVVAQPVAPFGFFVAGDPHAQPVAAVGRMATVPFAPHHGHRHWSTDLPRAAMLARADRGWLGRVRRVAPALPDVTEEGTDHPAWRVKKKLFALGPSAARAGDLRHLGDAAPSGAILGVRVADEGTKQALLATEAPAVFTTPHFDGYPALLVDLDAADIALLEELIADAWLAQAPKRLAATYLADTAGRQQP